MELKMYANQNTGLQWHNISRTYNLLAKFSDKNRKQHVKTYNLLSYLPPPYIHRLRELGENPKAVIAIYLWSPSSHRTPHHTHTHPPTYFALDKLFKKFSYYRRTDDEDVFLCSTLGEGATSLKKHSASHKWIPFPLRMQSSDVKEMQCLPLLNKDENSYNLWISGL